MNVFRQHVLLIRFKWVVYKQQKTELQLMLTEMRLVATGRIPFDAVQTYTPMSSLLIFIRVNVSPS